MSQPVNEVVPAGEVEMSSPNKNQYSAVLGSTPLEGKTSSELTWVNLNFKVKDKNILTKCWGKATAGSVSAILGPSGAGKSSLLNVLAGRSAKADGIAIDGKICVGGRVINPVTFRKNIAYVMQDDSLMATATPKEALAFSGRMRLPASVTKEQLDAKVDTLLDELGLTECANVLIGGPLIKGISGGQRKRTSVGVELITDPTLLFLDEPTSGLDSFSSFSLINLLKRVAAHNCTILLTIHQPSSETFFLFDSVIFMKEGRILYQGPVTSIVPYYAKFGYNCPSNYNPADFVMSLSQIETVEVLEEKKAFMPVLPELEGATESMRLGDSEVDFTAERSFLTQLYALTERETVNVYRDTNALIGRFVISGILNLLFGLIFLNAGGRGNDTSDDFNTHFGAIAMVLISGMFASAQTVMLSFPYERPMFLREYSTGTYGVAPYFLSKLTLEVPLNFIQCALILIILYWSIDLQGRFIYILLSIFGLFMASNSVAVVLGSLVTDVKTITELAPLLFIPQILFAGFFIRTSSIPVFLRWAQWLCSLKYTVNLVLLTEFNEDNASCNTSAAAKQNCKQVLDDNNIVASDYYISIIMLIVLVVVFRLIGPFILARKAKRFY